MDSIQQLKSILDDESSQREVSDPLLTKTLVIALSKCLEQTKYLREDLDMLQDRLVKHEVDTAQSFLKADNRFSTIEDLHTNIHTALAQKVDAIDRSLMDTQQYIRRWTVEITGIPEHVQQKDLKNFVIHQVLQRACGYRIYPRDIEACHRLKKVNANEPAHVVARLVNREDAENAIRGRHKLKSFPHLRRITITDNLCPRYKEIYDELTELKLSGVIKQSWSYNGKVFYKSTGNRRGPGKRVHHLDDLKHLKEIANLMELERQACQEIENYPSGSSSKSAVSMEKLVVNSGHDSKDTPNPTATHVVIPDDIPDLDLSSEDTVNSRTEPLVTNEVSPTIVNPSDNSCDPVHCDRPAEVAPGIPVLETPTIEDLVVTPTTTDEVPSTPDDESSCDVVNLSINSSSLESNNEPLSSGSTPVVPAVSFVKLDDDPSDPAIVVSSDDQFIPSNVGNESVVSADDVVTGRSQGQGGGTPGVPPPSVVPLVAEEMNELSALSNDDDTSHSSIVAVLYDVLNEVTNAVESLAPSFDTVATPIATVTLSDDASVNVIECPSFPVADEQPTVSPQTEIVSASSSVTEEDVFVEPVKSAPSVSAPAPSQSPQRPISEEIHDRFYSCSASIDGLQLKLKRETVSFLNEFCHSLDSSSPNSPSRKSHSITHDQLASFSESRLSHAGFFNSNDSVPDISVKLSRCNSYASLLTEHDSSG